MAASEGRRRDVIGELDKHQDWDAWKKGVRQEVTNITELIEQYIPSSKWLTSENSGKFSY